MDKLSYNMNSDEECSFLAETLCSSARKVLKGREGPSSLPAHRSQQMRATEQSYLTKEDNITNCANSYFLAYPGDTPCTTAVLPGLPSIDSVRAGAGEDRHSLAQAAAAAQAINCLCAQRDRQRRPFRKRKLPNAALEMKLRASPRRA